MTETSPTPAPTAPASLIRYVDYLQEQIKASYSRGLKSASTLACTRLNTALAEVEIETLRVLLAKCQSPESTKVVRLRLARALAEEINYWQALISAQSWRDKERDSWVQKRLVAFNKLKTLVGGITDLQELCQIANLLGVNSKERLFVRRRILQVFDSQICQLQHNAVALIRCHQMMPQDLGSSLTQTHLRNQVSKIKSRSYLQRLLGLTKPDSEPHLMIVGRLRQLGEVILPQPMPATV